MRHDRRRSPNGRDVAGTERAGESYSLGDDLLRHSLHHREGCRSQGHARRRVPANPESLAADTGRHHRVDLPLRAGRGRRLQAGCQRRRQGHHAANRHVLGRPVRQAHRSLGHEWATFEETADQRSVLFCRHGVLSWRFEREKGVRTPNAWFGVSRHRYRWPDPNSTSAWISSSPSTKNGAIRFRTSSRTVCRAAAGSLTNNWPWRPPPASNGCQYSSKDLNRCARLSRVRRIAFNSALASNRSSVWASAKAEG